METINEKPKGRGRAKKLKSDEEVVDSTTKTIEPVEDRTSKRRAVTKKAIVEVEDEDIKKTKAPKRAPKKNIQAAEVKPTNGDVEMPEENIPAPKKGRAKKVITPPTETVIVSPKGKKNGASPVKPVIVSPKSKTNGATPVEEVIVSPKGKRGKPAASSDETVEANSDSPPATKRGRGKPAKAAEPKPVVVKKAAVVSKRKAAAPEKKKSDEIEEDEEEVVIIAEPEVVKPKRGKPQKKVAATVEETIKEDVVKVVKKGGAANKKVVEDKNVKIIPEKSSRRGRKINPEVNYEDNNEENETKSKKRKIVVPKENGEEAPKKTTAKKEKTEKVVNKNISEFSTINFNIENTDWNLKIASWNVAGIRAWLQKGGLEYIEHEKPDIICLQETKCSNDDMPTTATISGYHPYWLCNSGGYAGVALYSKIMPMNIKYGIGDKETDADAGRLMTAEFEKFYLVCVYVPNSGRKLVSLPKRMDWDEKFQQFLKKLDKTKPVILCGDMNVSHLEIDLKNPKTNKRNAGFTQEERDGLTKLLSLGFVDTFRQLYPNRVNAYTFWTYMANARKKNVGWRLDYFILSERISNKVIDNVIRSEVYGSDHCPIVLFLNI